MRIIHEPTLDRFRQPRTCEYCFKACSSPDPHHLSAKGMGGGGRIDLACNLISLCRECHTSLHDGNIDRAELLNVVARREKTTIDAIRTVIYLVRRLPKDAGPATIWQEIECLDNPIARRLARDELTFVGKL